MGRSERLRDDRGRLLAARLLRIDAKARTSMADDLARGRTTEIDALCGEVVRLARAHGIATPVNARIAELVRAWPGDPRARRISSWSSRSTPSCGVAA